MLLLYITYIESGLEYLLRISNYSIVVFKLIVKITYHSELY